MNRISRKMGQMLIFVCICCLGTIIFSGCAWLQSSDTYVPGGQENGSPPTLYSLTVAPNPTCPGNIVNLTASYADRDADLQFGVAAVSVDGGDLSKIAFHTTYPSGMLTIPLAVSYYSRSSNMRIVLKIRDSSGNWSNAVSTVLSVQ